MAFDADKNMGVIAFVQRIDILFLSIRFFLYDSLAFKGTQATIDGGKYSKDLGLKLTTPTVTSISASTGAYTF